MLANLCLDTLDESLEAGGYKVVRYADDFVVSRQSRPAIERARELTGIRSRFLRLRLKEEKTSILEGQEGLRFLGVLFFRDMLLRPFHTDPFRAASPPSPAHFPGISQQPAAPAPPRYPPPRTLMPVIYIRQQGAMVRKRGGRL